VLYKGDRESDDTDKVQYRSITDENSHGENASHIFSSTEMNIEGINDWRLVHQDLR